MDSEAQTVVDAIETAFHGVNRGEITLNEAEVIDNYGSAAERAAARARDTEARWQEVPDAHVANAAAALCHVDPVSWRYYVPRYMVWSLQNFRTSVSMSSDATIYTFDLVDEANLAVHARTRFAQLDAAQSAAVARYLRYMSGNDDFADARVAAEALRKHWGRFLD